MDSATLAAFLAPGTDAYTFRFLGGKYGQEDLKNKVLRMIGNPDIRLVEDPLRILRALRFSAVLGFSVDEDTEAAAKELAGNLEFYDVDFLGIYKVPYVLQNRVNV